MTKPQTSKKEGRRNPFPRFRFLIEVPESLLPIAITFLRNFTELTIHSLQRNRAADWGSASLNCEFDLTAREMKLIEVFAAHPGEVLSRNNRLNIVWGIDYFGTTRTLDQHIAQLRKKIEPTPAVPKTLTTVHGVGYRFEPGKSR